MSDFKKVEPIKNYEEYGNTGLLVKTFLTIEEIGAIVNNCLKENDPIRRMLVYYSNLVEFATNLDLDKFVDEEGLVKADSVYNYLAEKDLLWFDDYIHNVRDIKKIIGEVESIYNVVKDAVSGLSETMNTDELIKSLGEVSENLKEQQELHQEIVG